LTPAPLLPFWEKGLGDEGRLAKLGCTPIREVKAPTHEVEGGKG